MRPLPLLAFLSSLAHTQEKQDHRGIMDGRKRLMPKHSVNMKSLSVYGRGFILILLYMSIGLFSVEDWEQIIFRAEVYKPSPNW